MQSAWHARLALGFEKRPEGTVLRQRRHSGPLRVQKPFYPEGPVCHVYLIHPPGGVVGGDRIELEALSRPHTEALMTTPAASKFYRSDGPVAQQTIDLRVADGAALEWLPQETIFFSGARVSSQTRVELSGAARFIGWETLVFGRPACNEAFTHGQLSNRFQLYHDSHPVLREHTLLNPRSMDSVCGLRGHALMATLWVFPATQADLERARTLAGAHRWFGATWVEGLLICRLLGDQAEPVQATFRAIWAALRPSVLARTACPPRIWAT